MKKTDLTPDGFKQKNAFSFLSLKEKAFHA
jgi:hypothetical protein